MKKDLPEVGGIYQYYGNDFPWAKKGFRIKVLKVDESGILIKNEHDSDTFSDRKSLVFFWDNFKPI